LQAVLKSVRDRRVAIQRGEIESDVTAIAAPIFDWEDNPVVVVGALVSKHAAEDRVASVAALVAKFARELSVQKPSFPLEK
jgi:DNA-binding IclR family transcriptional regulator